MDTKLIEKRPVVVSTTIHVHSLTPTSKSKLSDTSIAKQAFIFEEVFFSALRIVRKYSFENCSRIKTNINIFRLVFRIVLLKCDIKGLGGDRL